MLNPEVEVVKKLKLIVKAAFETYHADPGTCPRNIHLLMILASACRTSPDEETPTTRRWIEMKVDLDTEMDVDTTSDELADRTDLDIGDGMPIDGEVVLATSVGDSVSRPLKVQSKLATENSCSRLGLKLARGAKHCGLGVFLVSQKNWFLPGLHQQSLSCIPKTVK